MKLVITDVAGADHDLDQVILGLAGDIAILHNRIKALEEHLGLAKEEPNDVVEELTHADVEIAS